jgi:chemotaxis protein MotB
VQELARYRSEFFGRLRAILGNRSDIRIVGDRFVFQSEVFFDAGQAALLPEGRAELDRLASALAELERQIPAEIPWVLRVDGHTDVRPIASAQYPSNWELSAGRALGVVKAMTDAGMPGDALSAAGYGEHHPVARNDSDAGRKENRRIEIVLVPDLSMLPGFEELKRVVEGK